MSENDTPKTEAPSPADTGGYSAPSREVWESLHSEHRAALARVSELEATAARVSELETSMSSHSAALDAARRSGDIRVALASAGVAPAYHGYLAERATGQEDLGAWVDSLRSAEPAFFGASPAPPSQASTGSTPDQAASPTPPPRVVSNEVGDLQAALGAGQSYTHKEWGELRNLRKLG